MALSRPDNSGKPGNGHQMSTSRENIRIYQQQKCKSGVTMKYNSAIHIND